MVASSAVDLLNGGLESSLPVVLPSAPIILVPAWHTFVLIVEFWRSLSKGYGEWRSHMASSSRLTTYGFAALPELSLLAWVAFGLRLAKTSPRSLFGSVPAGLYAIRQDLGVAFVFWIGSLMILGSIGALWLSVDAAVNHRATPIHDGRPLRLILRNNRRCA